MRHSAKAVTKQSFNQKMHQSIEIMQMDAANLHEMILQESCENIFIMPASSGCYGSNNQDYSQEYFSNHANHDARQPSLHEHLVMQINTSIDKNHHTVAFLLLDNMEDNGYFSTTIEELSININTPINIIRKTIAALKFLEPTGCFSFSLAECLKTQLEDKAQLTNMHTIALDNLHLVATKNVQELKKLGLKASEFEKILADIKSCNPKPGNAFAKNNESMTRIVDVFVDRSGVKLNEDAFPKIDVELLQTHTMNMDAAIKQQYNRAKFLHNALAQRARTILKIATAIFSLQRPCFEAGIGKLQPMTLADISSETGLHASSISRLSNCTLECKFGIYCFKEFFSSKVSSNVFENDFSSVAVKRIIKDIIVSEEKTLSDGAISQLLEAKGIKVARRTVAKYRESIGIPNASTRHRQLLFK